MSRQRRRRGLPRRTAVYQAFGAGDRLLYVGKSWDLERRLDDHRTKAGEYDNQWIAADVETFLIRTADPVHNIQCRGGPLQRNPTVPSVASHSEARALWRGFAASSLNFGSP
jgi:hypothetical protein